MLGPCCCTASLDAHDAQRDALEAAVSTDWDVVRECTASGCLKWRPAPEAALQSTRPPADGEGASGQQQTAKVDTDGAEAASQESLALRSLLKRFVQDMVRGSAFLVVVGNDRTESCSLVLTPNLQYLQLHVSGTTHNIPLRHIKDVCPGKLLESGFSPASLDELCSTVVLRNNECVTFKLGSLRERDDFTRCMKILSLSLDR